MQLRRFNQYLVAGNEPRDTSRRQLPWEQLHRMLPVDCINDMPLLRNAYCAVVRDVGQNELANSKR